MTTPVPTAQGKIAIFSKYLLPAGHPGGSHSFAHVAPVWRPVGPGILGQPGGTPPTRANVPQDGRRRWPTCPRPFLVAIFGGSGHLRVKHGKRASLSGNYLTILDIYMAVFDHVAIFEAGHFKVTGTSGHLRVRSHLVIPKPSRHQTSTCGLCPPFRHRPSAGSSHKNRSPSLPR
jgi:hypothetical protein